MAVINFIIDHEHIREDLSSQIDGHKLIFHTLSQYIPNSLIVILGGITYSKGNDFVETGPKQFTFINDKPFPPQVGEVLFVEYRTTTKRF